MTTGPAVAPLRAFRDLLTGEPFQSLQKMSRLYEDTGEENLSLAVWTPACEIYETDDQIVVKVELPSVKKENVKVNVKNNVLTISGERKFEEETNRENYRRTERNYGQFMRSFILPATIDTEKVSAEFKDGMLTVTLPKREETKPKAVEVKVA